MLKGWEEEYLDSLYFLAHRITWLIRVRVILRQKTKRCSVNKKGLSCVLARAVCPNDAWAMRPEMRWHFQAKAEHNCRFGYPHLPKGREIIHRGTPMHFLADIARLALEILNNGCLFSEKVSSNAWVETV